MTASTPEIYYYQCLRKVLRGKKLLKGLIYTLSLALLPSICFSITAATGAVWSGSDVIA